MTKFNVNYLYTWSVHLLRMLSHESNQSSVSVPLSIGCLYFVEVESNIIHVPLPLQNFMYSEAHIQIGKKKKIFLLFIFQYGSKV